MAAIPAPHGRRTPDAAAAPNVIGGRISDQANAGFQFVLQQPQVERGRHLVPYTGAMTFTPVSGKRHKSATLVERGGDFVLYGLQQLWQRDRQRE